MMIIRHLQYITALAGERHFARAAAACNVTQSILSAGIKQLEGSLGVLIAERGQHFVGLTAEGERVLAWAQRVLVDYGGLRQELSESRGGMVGQLGIGAIPVSLPIISLVVVYTIMMLFVRSGFSRCQERLCLPIRSHRARGTFGRRTRAASSFSISSKAR